MKNFEKYAAMGQRDALLLAKLAMSVEEMFGGETKKKVPPPVPLAALKKPVVDPAAKARAVKGPAAPMAFRGKTSSFLERYLAGG